MIRRLSLSRLGKRRGHSKEVESVLEVISACYSPLLICVEWKRGLHRKGADLGVLIVKTFNRGRRCCERYV
jgi:hypothetical protein